MKLSTPGLREAHPIWPLVVALGALACAKQPLATPRASNKVSCPGLALEITVSDADTSGSLMVSANPGGSSLAPATTYSWSASVGTFADPAARMTSYACPPSTTPQTLVIHVSASNGTCTVSQQSVVVCFNVINIVTGAGGAPYVYRGFGGSGAGSGGADGGPGDDAGSDGQADATVAVDGSCGLDPTMDEGAACNQCTIDNCTTLETVQLIAKPDPAHPVQVIAGCHHLASDTQRQNCEALYCCIRSSRCFKDGDYTPCWCGTADPTNCASGAEVANGPCIQEIQAAAGSDQGPQISNRIVDPTYPLGGAINLAACRASFCADGRTPACGGF